MDELIKFKESVSKRITQNSQNKSLLQSSQSFLEETIKAKYSYNFSWMGRPIIQYPQDMMAMQEIIWKVKPDLIIETGIAHGGSLIFSASMLELIGKGEVVGIDIDIRPHNRREIEAHPMAKRIKMIQGSSVSSEVVDQVKALAAGKETVLICLDSNHTHEHVLAELKAYAALTTIGSYCIVFDTVVEKLPEDFDWNGRWGVGDNPYTAVHEFLKDHPEFEIDKDLQHKLLITVAPDGYLKRVR